MSFLRLMARVIAWSVAISWILLGLFMLVLCFPVGILCLIGAALPITVARKLEMKGSEAETPQAMGPA